jgi:RNA-directed DNA polymerase
VAGHHRLPLLAACGRPHGGGVHKSRSRLAYRQAVEPSPSQDNGAIPQGDDPAGFTHSFYDPGVLTKDDGSARLIEAPKSGLKHLQRRILSHILERIPPHPAVHGFVKRRSIKTFAAPHTGQRVVLRMDLKDFFPSFRAARIQAFFRTIGYPEPVADLLGGICTTSAPRALCKLLPLHSQPHLPQGAPTSPALANLCFWRMDCRLTGLARTAGATYTRYADDLAFSGGEAFERCVDRFPIQVAAILSDEDFRVNHRKTRVMRQGVRQHLAGLVVNDHINIRRADFDLLKAILTNCVRHGAGGENRAHLEGRVGFVESINPAKGLHLRRIFDQITWP